MHRNGVMNCFFRFKLVCFVMAQIFSSLLVPRIFFSLSYFLELLSVRPLVGSPGLSAARRASDTARDTARLIRGEMSRREAVSAEAETARPSEQRCHLGRRAGRGSRGAGGAAQRGVVRRHRLPVVVAWGHRVASHGGPGQAASAACFVD